MKRTAWITAIGTLVTAGTLMSTVAFADSTSSGGGVQSPTKNSAVRQQLKAQLQADRTELKQLVSQNKQLNQQLKSALQAYKANGGKVTSDVQLKTDMQQFRQLAKRAKVDRSTLKQDVTSKKRSRLSADLRKLISDEQRMLVDKQQILHDLSGTPADTPSANTNA